MYYVHCGVIIIESCIIFFNCFLNSYAYTLKEYKVNFVIEELEYELNYRFSSFSMFIIFYNCY